MTTARLSTLWSRGRAAGLGLLAAAALAATPAATPAAAADYPKRDITMIIPFGVGGGSDTLARTISGVIAKQGLLPVQILAENRPGGSGAVGYTYVARQANNPHVIATVSVSFFTTPLLGGSPVSYKDFTPLASIAQSPYILAVPAASKIKSFADLKGARRLMTGTVGVVSDAALLARQTSNALGIQIDAVPFDGEGEVMAAVLGGHVDIVFLNPAEVLPQIKAGTLRPLAISSGTRSSALPDVPTFKELGTNIEHTQLRGLVMPRGVAPDVVAFWEGVLQKVAASPEWKEQYIDRFHDLPDYKNAKEFAVALERTNESYRQLMTELKLIK